MPELGVPNVKLALPTVLMPRKTVGFDPTGAIIAKVQTKCKPFFAEKRTIVLRFLSVPDRSRSFRVVREAAPPQGVDRARHCVFGVLPGFIVEAVVELFDEPAHILPDRRHTRLLHAAQLLRKGGELLAREHVRRKAQEVLQVREAEAAALPHGGAELVVVFPQVQHRADAGRHVLRDMRAEDAVVAEGLQPVQRLRVGVPRLAALARADGVHGLGGALRLGQEPAHGSVRIVKMGFQHQRVSETVAHAVEQLMVPRAETVGVDLDAPLGLHDAAAEEALGPGGLRPLGQRAQEAGFPLAQGVPDRDRINMVLHAAPPQNGQVAVRVRLLRASRGKSAGKVREAAQSMSLPWACMARFRARSP